MVNDVFVKFHVFSLLFRQLDDVMTTIIKFFYLGDSEVIVVQLGDEVLSKIRLLRLPLQLIEVQLGYDVLNARAFLLQLFYLFWLTLQYHIGCINSHTLCLFHDSLGLLMSLRQNQLQNCRLLILQIRLDGFVQGVLIIDCAQDAFVEVIELECLWKRLNPLQCLCRLDQFINVTSLHFESFDV